MSNEEKAKSLWYHFCTEKSCNGYNDCKLCPKSQVHPQLLEMAQWKQEQMIERITKLLKENCGDDWYITRYSYDDAVLDRDELLKDLIQILKED